MRGVSIFTIVVVITTVSIRQRCEGDGGVRFKNRNLKMSAGLSSSRRRWEVSGLSNVW